jgi:hypothetical protein
MRQIYDTPAYYSQQQYESQEERSDVQNKLVSSPSSDGITGGYHKLGQKSSRLYYKGDILTLWLFLSDVFERYDELTLCSCDMLSNTPH